MITRKGLTGWVEDPKDVAAREERRAAFYKDNPEAATGPFKRTAALGAADLYLGECLRVMASLPENSADMVFCDLPYGVTACAWDSIIPFADLWAAYGRVVKERGAIVLTATQPFASALVMSNPKWFRHEWVWDKVGCAGFQLAKHRPMQQHEHVLVFGQESPDWWPIMRMHDVPLFSGKHTPSSVSPISNDDGLAREHFYKYPRSPLSNGTCPNCNEPLPPGDFIRVSKRMGTNFHPSEKPVALLAYLIQTYSRPGDTILDNTMGSGSTGVACIDEGRKFIGIEMDLDYFNTSTSRIEEEFESERAGVGYVFGTDSDGLLISRIVPEDISQPKMGW
jgi:site-specific DNA-methyltransferase (adenine-specific)